MFSYFQILSAADVNTDIFESLTSRLLSSFLDRWLALVQRSCWMHESRMWILSHLNWIPSCTPLSQLLLTIFEGAGNNGDFVLSVLHFTSCSHQGHSPTCKLCWTMISDLCRHGLLISSSVSSGNGVWNCSILVYTVQFHFYLAFFLWLTQLNIKSL